MIRGYCSVVLLRTNSLERFIFERAPRLLLSMVISGKASIIRTKQRVLNVMKTIHKDVKV